MYRSLQDKCVGDPIPYNRLVYLAAEKLKYSAPTLLDLRLLVFQYPNFSIVSSLQLVYLEQIELEDPVFYYRRAAKIMNDLRGKGAQQEQDATTPIVIAHYINGVTNTKVCTIENK